MAKYIIQVPGFKSIFGFIKGVYEVEGPDSSPHEFYLDSGSYTIEIPASEVSRYYEEGTDIAEVLRDELRSGSVKKLVDAGKELAELRKEKESLTASNFEAGFNLRKAHETLDQIIAEIVLIKGAHSEFGLNEEYPVTSLQIIKHKLFSLSKGYTTELNSIGTKMKKFFYSLGYVVNEDNIQEMADMLQVVNEDILKNENVQGNRNCPVKVPADVAKSLDILIAVGRDWAHSSIMFYSYLPTEAENQTFNPMYIPHLSKVSLWRLGHMDLFPKLMINGYEAEKTEREIRNEKLEEVFKGYAQDEYTLDYAMELIEKLYEGEQA